MVRLPLFTVFFSVKLDQTEKRASSQFPFPFREHRQMLHLVANSLALSNCSQMWFRQLGSQDEAAQGADGEADSSDGWRHGQLDPGVQAHRRGIPRYSRQILGNLIPKCNIAACNCGFLKIGAAISSVQASDSRTTPTRSGATTICCALRDRTSSRRFTWYAPHRTINNNIT